MVALLRIAVALGAVLSCSASPSAPGEGHGGGGGPLGDATGGFAGDGGGGLITSRPALAAPGDGYKADSKRAFVHVERGTTDPTLCEGRSVVIDISLRRFSRASRPPQPDDYNFSEVQVEYSAIKYRDCAADEPSSGSSGYYSYGTSSKCCSDGISFNGYDSVRPAAFTFTKDKRGLSHAEVNLEVALYDAGASTSSGSAGQTVATAVLALQVDCTTVNSRTTEFTSEVCSDGQCFSTSGAGNEYKCRGRFGDASVSGTIDGKPSDMILTSDGAQSAMLRLPCDTAAGMDDRRVKVFQILAANGELSRAAWSLGREYHRDVHPRKRTSLDPDTPCDVIDKVLQLRNLVSLSLRGDMSAFDLRLPPTLRCLTLSNGFAGSFTNGVPPSVTVLHLVRRGNSQPPLTSFIAQVPNLQRLNMDGDLELTPEQEVSGEAHTVHITWPKHVTEVMLLGHRCCCNLPDTLQQLSLWDSPMLAARALPLGLQSLQVTVNHYSTELPALPEGMRELNIRVYGRAAVRVPQLPSTLKTLSITAMFNYSHIDWAVPPVPLPKALEVATLHGVDTDAPLGYLPANLRELSLFECGGSFNKPLPAMPASLRVLQLSRWHDHAVDIPEGVEVLVLPCALQAKVSVPPRAQVEWL